MAVEEEVSPALRPEVVMWVEEPEGGVPQKQPWLLETAERPGSMLCDLQSQLTVG